jgi:hypothetical protein
MSYDAYGNDWIGDKFEAFKPTREQYQRLSDDEQRLFDKINYFNTLSKTIQMDTGSSNYVSPQEHAKYDGLVAKMKTEPKRRGWFSGGRKSRKSRKSRRSRKSRKYRRSY